MPDLLSDSLVFVRHLIDDTDDTDYEYSDNRLSTLIFVAASFVNSDIRASYTLNLCNQTISPAPDSDFINLVSLKAACMIMRSAHTSYARNDFRVSDGPTTVDLKGAADKIKAAADSLCDQYERAKLDLIMGRTVSGCIISTPNSES